MAITWSSQSRRMESEPRSSPRSLEHDELLAQDEDLQGELTAGLQAREEAGKQASDQVNHAWAGPAVLYGKRYVFSADGPLRRDRSEASPAGPGLGGQEAIRNA